MFLLAGCSQAHPTGLVMSPDPQASGALIKGGAKAPDATFLDLDGKPIRLADLIKGKKGVILDFWFYDCPPCLDEFRHLQPMASALEKQGFALLGVDRLDKAGSVKEYEKRHHFTIPMALSQTGAASADNLFGVQGSPTTVVISPQGKVVGVFEGEDDAGLAKSLRRLGFQGKS